MDVERFCWDCTSDRGAPPQDNDFAGLCGHNQNVAVLCDGCGELVWVDHRGRVVQKTGQLKTSAAYKKTG